MAKKKKPIKFDAMLTDEQMREAGGKVLNDQNVRFRAALAVLTKTSDELTEMALKDAQSEYEDMATPTMIEWFEDGEGQARAQAEMFQGAAARIKSAIYNVSLIAEAS